MACNKRKPMMMSLFVWPGMWTRDVSSRNTWISKEKKGTLRIYIVLNAKMLKSLKNINTKKVTET